MRYLVLGTILKNGANTGLRQPVTVDLFLMYACQWHERIGKIPSRAPARASAG
jgi:hypothetical protein